jgi:hypothetical protein
MREQKLPEWAQRVGAEVRDRAEQLPTNEAYLVDVTELLRAIREDEGERREQAASLLERRPPA